MLLGAGVAPRRAAEFASRLGLLSFADPPGIGGALRGDRFQGLMLDYLRNETSGSLRIEDAVVPLAVTGFDLRNMRGKVLKSGCMGRAARASACFPGLFQPVGWHDDDGEGSNGILPPHILIDGGIADPHGLVGLSELIPNRTKRVVNLVVGSFGGGSAPPGPSDMPPGVNAAEVVSLSIRGTPQCGPWAMKNGPRATEAARTAVAAVLDMPMHRGTEEGHYELHIDASVFVPE